MHSHRHVIIVQRRAYDKIQKLGLGRRPIVDENTKLRQEDGPENNVPHFYADDELIRELFAQFNMISMKQIETFVQKPHEVKVFESWHYHVLAQKPAKATI